MLILMWVLDCHILAMKFYRMYIVVYSIRSVTICSGSLYFLLHVHFFLFLILRSGIVGTGEVRPAEMVVSEFSESHFGECYVISVLRNVT